MNRIYGTPEDEALYCGEPGSSIVTLTSSPLMEDFCTEEEIAEFNAANALKELPSV